MHTSSSLRDYLLNRLVRVFVASVGLLIFAFGYYLQLVVSVGVSPWHALNQGLSQVLGLSFGQVSVIISVCVVATDLLLREPIGVGTLLDAFLVGWGTDFFIGLELIPYQEDIWMSLLILVLSIVIICFSQVIYMKAGLSCGPRDALMVAIGKRLRRLPIGVIGVMMNCAVMLAGFWMGGSIGIGTLINITCFGIIMQAVFKLCRFDPRDVEQEGLTETIRAFFTALKGRRDSFPFGIKLK